MVSKVFLQIEKAKMEAGSVKLTTIFPIQTSASSTAPDIKLVGNHGLYKPLTAHKLILARFSPLLFHVLAELEPQDDDNVLLFPDVTPRHLDLILSLAYSGTARSVSKDEVSAIKAICKNLSVCVFLDHEEIGSESKIVVVSDVESDNNGFLERETSSEKSEGEETRIPHLTKRCELKMVSFKFDHIERNGDIYFCMYPGCDHKESFKTISGCKNHQLRYHATDADKTFKCSYCDQRFASNQLRNKHQNLVHNKRFPCEHCGKTFSEKSRLLIHNRVHSGDRPYECDLCGFRCAQKDNLRIHKEFKHPMSGSFEKKFNCKICSALFLTQGNLKRHIRTHSDLKPYVCETCGKSFKDPGTLKQHTFKHGGQTFVCKFCSQKFNSPLYLSRHMNRVHPVDGIQTNICSICGKGFSSNYLLNEHVNSVHDHVKHSCPHCHVVIGRFSSVTRHLRKGRCRGIIRTQHE